MKNQNFLDLEIKLKTDYDNATSKLSLQLNKEIREKNVEIERSITLLKNLKHNLEISEKQIISLREQNQST